MKATHKLMMCFMAVTLGLVTVKAEEAVKADATKPAAEAAKPEGEKVEAKPVEAAEPEEMVITDGVKPGTFTQDYDAAMAYAKEKSLPIMLVFTGSDWCGWCKIMDKNVFSQPEWAAYSKDNLVQIWLDFPKNKDLVPEKYRERNNDIRGKYGVRGYPTYIILDSNGSKLGKLGAGRDKTPASFKAELQKLLIMTANGIKAFTTKLKPEDAEVVLKAFNEYNALSAQQTELQAKLTAVKSETEAKKTALEEAMEKGKVNAMSELQKAEYDAANAALEEANAKLQEWMKKNSRTKVTPELRKAFNELNKAVQDAQAKVDSF